MATLVQTSPATRHPPQAYPIVRPSSSSAVQRSQPLYLVTSQPQMYMQQQQPPFMAINYDYTRQTYQAQQQAKQAQLQRRQNNTLQQPTSAPPHPRPQQGMHVRSRSDEALREKSRAQSQLQSSVQMTSQPQAQSAPRPQSQGMQGFRPSTALPSPPLVVGIQQRPSSADGPKRTDNFDVARGRPHLDQRPRYAPGSATSRDNMYMPPPPVLNGYGRQPRYSAEDVTTIRNAGYHNQQSYGPQQFPTHSQYQGQQQYSMQQYHPNPRPASVQSLQHPPSQIRFQQPQPKSPHAKPQQSSFIPQQIPNIAHRQSSLPQNPSRDYPPNISRVTSPPPQQLKRASSSPELAPPQSIPTHRKSSSSSSGASAASAPSQLETSSSHSSIPPPSEQHTPFTPSPLGKQVDPPMISITPVIVEPKQKSLSSRLRRALSFSSSSNLSTSASTPDLHAAAQEDGDFDNTDTVSISSTASSASIMLRKMSQGFKKSRKSIIGIFKGAKGRRAAREEGEQEEEPEDKFPFGVPGEESSVKVSYATAEGEFSNEEGERRKSMVFSEREASTVQVQLSSKKKGKGNQSAEPVNIRGILKNTDSRHSSFEVPPEATIEPVPSIKEALIANSASTAGNTPSDFAKSLASTLDSQFNHLSDTTITPPATDGEESPKPDESYFDLAPPTPTVQRHAATAPATPTGQTTRRGIQFSPRLEVHETWHSAEYDRRGEPATCNRLTAQLAQMIKEELNAFKMEEMIVHEESRNYTHFF